jgi:signal transduction histidine kinase
LETTNDHFPEVQLSIEGDENIQTAEDVSLNIYRVLNESLNNIHRHAKAEHVEIYIELRPDNIFLEVKDDGCGFFVPQPLGKLLLDQHFGLVGMRERVEYMQGELQIESSPGEGTRITATVPLNDFH